ncbi:hypothetical protein BH09ACT5_BH09ACT5_18190 [soil metagenome]
MRIRRLIAVAATASLLAAGLAACAPTPVVTPVVVNANDIQGETVEVPLNSTLVINTGDLPVDSYTADVADPAIATFVKGARAGDFETSPGFTPKKVGETEVTMSNEDGGIQDLVFTLRVVPVPAGTGIIGGSGK